MEVGDVIFVEDLFDEGGEFSWEEWLDVVGRYEEVCVYVVVV